MTGCYLILSWWKIYRGSQTEWSCSPSRNIRLSFFKLVVLKNLKGRRLSQVLGHQTTMQLNFMVLGLLKSIVIFSDYVLHC